MRTTFQKIMSIPLQTESYVGEALASHHWILTMCWKIGRIRCMRCLFENVEESLSRYVGSQWRFLSYIHIKDFLIFLNLLMNSKTGS